jgi:hypothetical protein
MLTMEFLRSQDSTAASTQNYHYNDREDNFSRVRDQVLEWVVNILWDVVRPLVGFYGILL